MRSSIHVRDKQSPVLSVLASTIGLLTTAVCDKNAREKTINFTLTVRFVGGIFKRASACDWDTYTTHIRSYSQQNSLTVELVDHTYDGLHVGAGRTLCQSTVALYLDHFDFHFLCVCCTTLPSVLWRCWLGSRKGIRPVKNWAVGCWHGYLSGVRCRLAYGPADATATHCLLLQ